MQNRDVISAEPRLNLSDPLDVDDHRAMDPHELRETCMDPATRNLVKLEVEEAGSTDGVLSVLMGDDVDSRKTFIQTNAKDVRFIDA